MLFIDNNYDNNTSELQYLIIDNRYLMRFYYNYYITISEEALHTQAVNLIKMFFRKVLRHQKVCLKDFNTKQTTKNTNLKCFQKIITFIFKG